MRLGEATWNEVDVATRLMADDGTLSPVILIPVGSTEQHGPHLPLSTDLDIGLGLIARAFDHLPVDEPVWVLPALAIGTSQEHAAFAGTLSVPPEQGHTTMPPVKNDPLAIGDIWSR